MTTITLRAPAGDQTIPAREGATLLDVLRDASVAIGAACGGKVRCGKCRVRLLAGMLSEPGKEEIEILGADMRGGWRLACAARPLTDVTIELPSRDEGAKVLLAGADEQANTLNPASRRVEIHMDKPTLTDQRSDAERMLAYLGVCEAKPESLSSVPDAVRAPGGASAFLFRGALVGCGDRDARNLGVAVDVGTTTMASFLFDLDTGACLATDSCLNPQRDYGGDVISRADYTIQNPDGLSILQGKVAGAIGDMTKRMLSRAGGEAGDVRHIVAVGNTIMMHLLACLTPRHIAVMPFSPVYNRAFDLSAKQAALDLPNAVITCAPCVAGYVGADTVAAVLACGMDQMEGLSLMIDIGTNGEIALGGRDGMLCCSAAAGPAFEGAHIHCGSGAAKGAVDSVRIENSEVVLTTIGGCAPKSVCGSGLVDAVAEMKRAEIIDETGRIDEDEVPDAYARYLFDFEGKTAFSLDGRGADGVFLTQRDLREVQLAKAAIAAGIDVLLEEAGADFTQVRKLYLAGGFGNYIRRESAVAIGLLPEELANRIVPVGNAAGAGAKRMLLDADEEKRAEQIRVAMRYVELSARKDFQEKFVDRMFF